MQTPRLPWWLKWERICIQCRRPGFNPCVGKILWRKKQQSTPVFLPGKSHGQRSMPGLQSLGLQRVGQDWVTNTHMSTHLTLFKIEEHKSHYQASFRHSWTRKLRKTASLLSKKRHAVQTWQSWVLLWTKIEMNPPPFPAFCPLKLNTRLKPPFQCKCHSMSLVPFFSWKVNKNSLFSSC